MWRRDPWKRLRRNVRNSVESWFSRSAVAKLDGIHRGSIGHTFGDGEEPNQGHCISMGTSNAIENEPIGHIQRVVFVLTGGDRDSGLVTAENNGDEC
jgi:hypothetical protein